LGTPYGKFELDVYVVASEPYIIRRLGDIVSKLDRTSFWGEPPSWRTSYSGSTVEHSVKAESETKQMHGLLLDCGPAGYHTWLEITHSD
jgi:hypothetical protein